ncbi:metal ABC transporter ATP-binding protein [Ferrimonas sp. SCSIO 43195]|uniref:metal ABC transporter ATP-binding protein n=1 Tax=Ferrimonas sp. SCSIO 43195 TaxID=2822844 RepID=UPI0020764179|nr:metal ABC transporter ATP-binding protein [Ferrimonas sp. SCSIO 43195]USD39351.1 metal ABC transporter ATP-binding protein [Ferrimonas sp. SCSIO 43195]
MAPSVALKRLSLRYGAEHVLDDISLNLEGGQTHLFVGPNGGGKTSLLKSVLGLTPFRGVIEMDGEVKVGYVPQKAQFEASLPLSVMDFMLLNQSRRPLFWFHSARHKARAMEQLDQLGMAQRANRRMGQLSGGEQQRVLFAQALLQQPNLLILDEPTTGMDQQGIAVIDALISEQLRKGITLLAVHHDLEAIRKLPHPNLHLINRRYQGTVSPEQLQQMPFLHHSLEAS